jgi:hypothetical protein
MKITLRHTRQQRPSTTSANGNKNKRFNVAAAAETRHEVTLRLRRSEPTRSSLFSPSS